MPDRRDLAGLIVAFLIAAVCVGLGIWQLQRLGERRARNAVMLAARALPPLVVHAQLPGDSAMDRRLRARGRYDYVHERLWRPRSYEGVPGVDLVTPLRLPDGSALLVDRGWAPSPDGYHVDQQAYREGEGEGEGGDSGEVVGLGMRAPRGRGDVDPGVLKDSVPYPLLPFVLQEFPSDSPTVRPALRRWPAPPVSDGPHLSYAIQWFSFATILVIGSIALVRKRASEGRKPPQSVPLGYH
jgi:surfeit locus 1 family protein